MRDDRDVMSRSSRTVFIWVAVALGSAAAASAVYQFTAEARDRGRYPPPGQIVDIGGRRLHVLDMGKGSPAVVIVHALGGNTLDLLGFYRDLADDDLRVAVYDRAGLGFSDPPSRGRRTFAGMADELRNGLAAAGIGGPYVLAAHSFGGIVARQFAVRYPDDVAGLVLIDSSHEGQARRYPGRELRMVWRALRWRLRILGVRRLLAEAKGSWPDEDVPPEFAGEARAVSLTSKYRRAVVQEMLLAAGLHGRPPDLGDLPLTVLTAAGREETWMQMQRELAAISTSSKHVIADHGWHFLQRDNPELVRAVIREFVDEIRATDGIPLG